jgi:hypothetical protein
VKFSPTTRVSIWLIGVIVVVIAIVSFLGLR